MAKPGIVFTVDATVKCDAPGCGSDKFRLIIRGNVLKLTRYAQCVECGNTEPIDP